MSIPVEERVEATHLEDLKVNDLTEYFVDMDGIKELCDDLIELYKKEQSSTLGDEKYMKILEKEAYLIEDIALTSLNFITTHKKILKVMKACSSKHKNQTKPQK